MILGEILGERQLGETIIAKCRWMNASGLNLGTCSDAEVAETAKEFASYGQEDPPVEEKARVSAAPRRAEKRLSRAR